MAYKRHISLFLLLLISFKILIVPFVYLDFELRKEHIIQHLCENRFKPHLHCDGKCFLAKQLHKVAQEHARSETEKQATTIKKSLSDLFEESHIVATVTAKAVKMRQATSYEPAYRSSDFSASIPHPPAA